MTKKIFFAIPVLAATLLVGARSAEASSFSLLTNGGFEAGLTGWTVVDQLGGSGSWYSQSGTGSPLNGFSVAAPSSGSSAAMTDQGGPGAHMLYQDFVVPTNIVAALVQFDYYMNNQAGSFINGATLGTAAGANQQARVDIIDPGMDADPFTMDAGALLMNLFQASANTPNGYQTSSTDITALLQAHAGQTLRLRFAEADNQLYFQFGLDQIGLDGRTDDERSLEAVPEPATITLVALGGVALVARRLRRV